MEERCYDKEQCPYHHILEKQVNNSLPRWVFLSAFGTFVGVAMVFAGWHVSSLSAFDSKYHKDVKEFHISAERNKSLLIEVKTKQDMILEKLSEIEKNGSSNRRK